MSYMNMKRRHNGIRQQEIMIPSDSNQLILIWASFYRTNEKLEYIVATTIIIIIYILTSHYLSLM